MLDLSIILNFSHSHNTRKFEASKLMDSLNASYLSYGWTRWVYLSHCKKFVYKIPKVREGVTCNQREFELYTYSTTHPVAFPLASCELIDNAILKMEAVQTFGDLEGMQDLKDIGLEYPPWAEKVDSFQVGIDSKGDFVAYDYGDLELSDILV